jgi:hypothetical protein
MNKKSGVRIDENNNGTFEITYMGVFSQSVPSQTLLVRSFVDLEDLYYHIQKVRADIKYNRTDDMDNPHWKGGAE